MSDRVLLAPKCSRCHGAMTVGQHRQHHTCDPATIIGLACICRPGCTQAKVGDAGTCHPNCRPCLLMRGRPHADVVEWRKHPPKTAPTDLQQPHQLTMENH